MDGNSHHTLAGMAPERHLIQGPLFTIGETEAPRENGGWLRSLSERQSHSDTHRHCLRYQNLVGGQQRLVGGWWELYR